MASNLKQFVLIETEESIGHTEDEGVQACSSIVAREWIDFGENMDRDAWIEVPDVKGLVVRVWWPSHKKNPNTVIAMVRKAIPPVKTAGSGWEPQDAKILGHSSK
jgi:hypothetical protein